jgi:hypothetical protein
MTKQLNIRNDRAFEAAQRVAERLRETTTQVVVEALRRYERKTLRVPTYEELNPEERAFADRLLALAEAGRHEGEADATSDHSYLYDEHGAPK